MQGQLLDAKPYAFSQGVNELPKGLAPALSVQSNVCIDEVVIEQSSGHAVSNAKPKKRKDEGKWRTARVFISSTFKVRTRSPLLIVRTCMASVTT